MGRRKGVETAVAIMEAFRAHCTWSQQELAQEVGVTPRALRIALVECQRAGVPLERDEEHRSLVFWSVPGWWSRGLADEEMKACTRLVARLPPSRARDRLLSRLVGREAGEGGDAPSDAILRLLEDGAASKSTLSVSYHSTHQETPSARQVSIQRIEHGPRARFLALCHRTGTLKTFRVDRVEGAERAEHEPFRAATEEELAAYVAGSLDGFHGDALVDCTFVVRAQEAGWVTGNLPPGALRVEAGVEGAARIMVRTSALVVLARYVVGLGDAVRIESPALRVAVAALARGALRHALTASKPKPLARAGRPNSAPVAARAKRIR